MAQYRRGELPAGRNGERGKRLPIKVAALPAAVAAALTALPARAAADAPPLGVSFGWLLVCAAAVIALAILARRRLVQAETLRTTLRKRLTQVEAALEAGPAASYRWLAGGGEAFSPGVNSGFELPTDASFEDLLPLIDEASRESVRDAVERLRRDGSAFELTAGFAGRRAMVSGHRLFAEAEPLADAVWFVDVTQRDTARAERDRAQAEAARLRAVLDHLPLPVWRRAASTLEIIDGNAAYAKAVDAPPAVALAEGRELLPGGARPPGRVLAAQARDGGTPRTESQHAVIAGARQFLEVTEAPLEGTDELVGFARDLTELEAARTELSRHIAAHADVLENIASAVAIYGPDARLKFFNTAFAVLWRLEEDWLATEPALDEVLERLRERRRLPEYADFRAFKQQRLAMFTSLIESVEELMHLPDERTLRLVVSTHPFGGLTFVYEDVTDRLALERSYNTLIEVQRETLDNLYEGIAVFGSDGRLKLSNPAYGAIWGLTPDDLMGEPHVGEIVEKTRDFFDDGGDWAALKERIIARVTASTLATGQLERRDGSVLEVASVPLPDGNVLLSYLDVTDSNRVERALREKNEALETAGRLKSEFIANVSYELRTPLNAIIGFAEILTNQYFGELNTRQLDYSRGILDSSHRLLSLINDILDLATIEAGYMTLETDQVDIHTMMASVLALTRERARKQNLSLDFDCPPDVGTIVADERRLKQALFNLISNAIKFTPAGGTITISARRGAGEVALTVADTGVGIAREQQARVFEKFERGSPHARQSGAGLGLSLVKSFIELHGGRVEMESDPGKGTRVTCYLSAAGASAPGVSSPLPPAGESRPRREAAGE